MKSKPVISRVLTNRDVDEAIEHCLDQDAEAAALGFIDALEQACDAIDPIALPFVGHQSQARLLVEGSRERSTYRVRQPAGRCHDLRDGRTLRSLERPGDRCLLAVVA